LNCLFLERKLQLALSSQTGYHQQPDLQLLRILNTLENDKLNQAVAAFRTSIS
jgi:hypothetical protein